MSELVFCFYLKRWLRRNGYTGSYITEMKSSLIQRRIRPLSTNALNITKSPFKMPSWRFHGNPLIVGIPFAIRKSDYRGFDVWFGHPHAYLRFLSLETPAFSSLVVVEDVSLINNNYPLPQTLGFPNSLLSIQRTFIFPPDFLTKCYSKYISCNYKITTVWHQNYWII